jgi:hypothetical protein
MRPELLLALAFGVVFALLPALRMFAGRLPIAPACPDCRAVTCESGGILLLDRALTYVSMTSSRACTRCGWHGRMRWRLAADRAGKDR